MNHNATETWRPVPGFPGYKVSSLGFVHSDYRGGRVLSTRLTNSGYKHLTLCRNGERHQRYIHHLVAEAFVGPRPTGQQVRHLNGDRLDNRAANLNYGTASDNALDRVQHGTDQHARKTHCPKGHPYSPENTYYQKTRNNGRICRTCSREHARAARMRKVAQVAA